MKNLKKLFALVLAVAMVMSMAVTVGATEGQTPPIPYPQPLTSTGTITIAGSAAGTQYTIYRIMDIVQLDDDVNGHVNAFKVRDEWLNFVTNAKLFTVTEKGYVNTESLNTLDKVQLQTFAKSALDYAEENDIDFDGRSNKLLNSGNYTTQRAYQYGYYIMTSDRSEEYRQYSLFTLDRPNVTVEEKTEATISIQKFVQEDSKKDQDGGWTNENNAEIGQDVHFKLVIKVSAGDDAYIIEDIMPNFKDFANWKYTYSNGNIIDGYITHEPISNGVKITLHPHFRTLMEDGTTVTIEYTAKLKHTANTTSDGNLNTATLRYGLNASESLTPVVTTTLTNQLRVNKYDENGNRLKDASFQLHHLGTPLTFSELKINDEVVPNTYVVDPTTGTPTITTDENGVFTICGLDTDDTYVLKETATPDETYIPMEDKNIVITESDNHLVTVNVVNVRGIDMPGTGGTGTTIFYIAGGLLTAAALILLVTKKRMGA